MQRVKLLLFLLFVGGSWRHVRCTCVLESEFGFALNCAFKKSSLFRVRNLGGIKAHVGLGFTVGDELGFSESLSNVEGNRRRATQTNALQNRIIANAENLKRMSNQQGPPSNFQPSMLNGTDSTQNDPRAKIMYKPAATVPPFRPIPPVAERPATQTKRILTVMAGNQPKPVRMSNMATPALVGVAVPVFNAMPASITRKSGTPVDNDLNKEPSNTITTSYTLNNSESNNAITNNDVYTILANAQLSPNSIQALAAVPNVSIEDIKNAIIREKNMMKQKTQQQSLPIATSEATTHKVNTITLNRFSTDTSKVMNAPKEYYPVGYDKNFDDNFSSKVELPDTAFSCGNQKHFPGLYADENLGCMVFHVCALTDDGLLMKSFLCPESTLFDQTILKCNWWFYVDCKNSKRLYDSNIPISKSYQLMKALTFFTAYQKDQNGTK